MAGQSTKLILQSTFFCSRKTSKYLTSFDFLIKIKKSEKTEKTEIYSVGYPQTFSPQKLNIFFVTGEQVTDDEKIKTFIFGENTCSCSSCDCQNCDDLFPI
jgi:hypothetical protein